MSEPVALYIESAWEDGVTKEKVIARVSKMSSLKGDVDYVNAVYNTHMEDPNLLIPYIPYIHHFHAKFYHMTEDLTEYQIPYEKILPILIDNGINASLVSEYEGQRIIQDIVEPIACEQVRRQHAMLRRILGEI